MEKETKILKKEDYQIIEQIGEGSYGKVFKGIDKHTKEIVAIKVIELETDWLPLLAEINMVIDLHHDSIVNYYGWFFEEGKLWLIMEYCDGGSLSDIMNIIDSGLNELQLSAICRGVLESLVYIHSKNRIHRDIKAGNILITSAGKVKLCDFGVSAQLSDLNSKTGTVIGSPFWMAPEVITGVGHDTKADIWSFGITALELYSRYPPLFDIGVLPAMMQIPRNDPPQAPPHSSHAFREFISRIMKKDPQLRPTASELLNDPFIHNSDGRYVQIVQDLVQLFKDRNANQKELHFSNKVLDPNKDNSTLASAQRETLVVRTTQGYIPPVHVSSCDDDNGQYEEDEYEYEDEDENEEEEYTGTFVVNQDQLKTILYNDGTFIANDSGTFVENLGTFVVNNSFNETGTMVIENNEENKKNGNGLSGWKLNFDDGKSKDNQKQKRHFQNFRDQYLIYLLKNLKELALNELKEDKNEELVKANYEEVRTAIVDELIKRGKKIKNDFGSLDSPNEELEIKEEKEEKKVEMNVKQRKHEKEQKKNCQIY
ncbi:Serine/threonine-protein kinase 4 [Histomonas meleagridis]|uniref:Serine/threonine-protein kinase 4 n=1 Tax=Histomonas meleagridis TaxID=135588 RepID=UPI00355A80E7|nr:Serine/threonine-protein kinase 4 [Histomonas meleagridis]KAH0796996.1 Serine/threonine-protein kinase 4 [Histomonas meleagridis]